MIKKTVILLIVVLLQISCRSLAFDSKEWKKGDSKIRGKMSSSLVHQNILKGKTKEEVIQLLGKPDLESLFCVSYYLDGNHFLGLIYWCDFLEIVFDYQTDKAHIIQIND